jgi:hypothetical protein
LTDADAGGRSNGIGIVAVSSIRTAAELEEDESTPAFVPCCAVTIIMSLVSADIVSG